MDLENKKRFITDIVIKLRSDNSEVQSEAAEALNNQSDSLSAIELLLPYIHDQSKTVRQVIAQVLGEGGYSEVISSLLILTKDEDPYVRATAIYALSNFKENKLELVKTIEEKLKDTSSYVRSRAALCLGLLDVKRATTSLLEALKDSNGEVRGCAADALGRIGAKKAVAPIITLLNDPVVSTRKLAIIALSKLKDKKAVDALIAASKDENAWIRYYIAEALGKIGDVRALDILLWLRDNDNSETWEGKTVAEAATKAVKRIEKQLKIT